MSDSSSGPADAFVTIAEAAALLSVHEKRLRRLLKRPEYADRTGTGTRTTRTGTRTVSLLPPALIEDLRARLTLENNGDNGDTDTDSRNGDRPKSATGTGTRTGTLPVAPPVSALTIAAVYEQRIAEKERAHLAVIGEKDARIGELTAALEHEREQSRRLVDALAREQTLRALPAPSTASQEPETGRTGDDSRNGAEGPQTGTEAATPRASWWGRLLLRHDRRGEG